MSKFLEQFSKAVEDDDINALRTLFQSNLTLVKSESENGQYFDDVFGYGDSHSSFVAVMLEFGFSPDAASPINGFAPLIQAIGEQCLTSVQMLLEAGAAPHPPVGRPLLGAIHLRTKAKRLPLLRLLIKYGADVNRKHEWFDTGRYVTVLDEAKDPEIIDYLISIGARKASELPDEDIVGEPARVSPSNTEFDTDEIVTRFEKVFGISDGAGVLETIPSRIPVEVRIVKPNEQRKHFTLFTSGLSSQPMNTPAGQEDWQLAELYLQLPGDWQVDKVNDPEWNWPFLWLSQIARYPHENKTWLGGAFTIIANGEPPEPLAPNTKLSCLMLLSKKSFKRSDGQKVKVYQVTPIHTSERDLEMTDGVPALMRAFDRADVPWIVDVDRPPVV